MKDIRWKSLLHFITARHHHQDHHPNSKPNQTKLKPIQTKPHTRSLSFVLGKKWNVLIDITYYWENQPPLRLTPYYPHPILEQERTSKQTDKNNKERMWEGGRRWEGEPATASAASPNRPGPGLGSTPMWTDSHNFQKFRFRTWSTTGKVEGRAVWQELHRKNDYLDKPDDIPRLDVTGRDEVLQLGGGWERHLVLIRGGIASGKKTDRPHNPGSLRDHCGFLHVHGVIIPGPVVGPAAASCRGRIQIQSPWLPNTRPFAQEWD